MLFRSPGDADAAGPQTTPRGPQTWSQKVKPSFREEAGEIVKNRRSVIINENNQLGYLRVPGETRDASSPGISPRCLWKEGNQGKLHGPGPFYRLEWCVDLEDGQGPPQGQLNIQDSSVSVKPVKGHLTRNGRKCDLQPTALSPAERG